MITIAKFCAHNIPEWATYKKTLKRSKKRKIILEGVLVSNFNVYDAVV